MAFFEVTKPPLGIVCVALVVTIAVSGCGTSDEDRAVEYALKACEERPYGAFNLAEPTAPREPKAFRSLRTLEALDNWITKYPNIAAQNRSELEEHRAALEVYELAYAEYEVALDVYKASKAEYDDREREFLYERKKNATAAAQLDDAYRVLADPPSIEAFLFECAAVEELHG